MYKRVNLKLRERGGGGLLIAMKFWTLAQTMHLTTDCCIIFIRGPGLAT